ncbi:MAG: hypothetical protein KAI47_25820 [Deltaproteobacteria bacterium]|nr:hypothetical protein [Deltaproteobacteria bacterium]
MSDARPLRIQISALTLALAGMLLGACGYRAPLGGGDAGLSHDSVLTLDTGLSADSTTIGDSTIPRPDTHVTPGQVTVFTDRSHYGLSETAKAFAQNGLGETIWLPGCTFFSRDWQQPDGTWVGQGSDIDCFWEGNATPLKPGATTAGSGVHFHSPGRWRMSLTYGLSCKPQAPLTETHCTHLETVTSAPFTVEVTLADCQDLAKSYKKALTNAMNCDTTVNTPQCTKLVDTDISCGCNIYVQEDAHLQTLQKRFAAYGCAAKIPPCGIKCAPAPPSACLNNRCVPMGD